MYGNVGYALEGFFYVFIAAVLSAVFLAIYVIWTTFFGLTEWEVCSKMETDKAKIQCMEIYNE